MVVDLGVSEYLFRTGSGKAFKLFEGGCKIEGGYPRQFRGAGSMEGYHDVAQVHANGIRAVLAL